MFLFPGEVWQAHPTKVPRQRFQIRDTVRHQRHLPGVHPLPPLGRYQNQRTLDPDLRLVHAVQAQLHFHRTLRDDLGRCQNRPGYGRGTPDCLSRDAERPHQGLFAVVLSAVVHIRDPGTL